MPFKQIIPELTSEEINKKITEELFNKCWHEWELTKSDHDVRHYKCKCGLEYIARYFENWAKPPMPEYHNRNYYSSIADAWEISSKFIGRKQEEFAYHLLHSYGDNNHLGSDKFIMFLCDPEASMRICLSAIKILEDK